MTNDSTVLDLSQVIFSALVLIITAGLTSHLFHGYHNKKWRTSFLGLLLLMLVGTQMFYFIQAALHIPTYPYLYDSSLLRHDCLESGKGGKRSKSSKEEFDMNPCYNFTSSNNSSLIMISSNEPYISYTRNCPGGFGGQCTIDEPCDPCARETLHIWSSGRCRTCTSSFKGNCNFVLGVGPYCRESVNSKKVIPCKRCCTDGAPLIVNDTCY